VVLQNVPEIYPYIHTGGSWIYLSFEWAHVVLFLMALVFVVLILLVYQFVRVIEARWQGHENTDAADVLAVLDRALPSLPPTPLAAASSLSPSRSELGPAAADVEDAKAGDPPAAVASADDATNGEAADALGDRRRSSVLRELSQRFTVSRRRLRSSQRQAQYYLLQYQFKRVHKLTNVKSFNFLDYLSRALRGHIIHIIEPSRKT
jgi:hypothetical protein